MLTGTVLHVHTQSIQIYKGPHMVRNTFPVSSVLMNVCGSSKSAKHQDKSVKLEDERIPEDDGEGWDGVTQK